MERKRQKELPFVGCDRVDEDVTINVNGVTLREDGVLILKDRQINRRTGHHRAQWEITASTMKQKPLSTETNKK